MPEPVRKSKATGIRLGPEHADMLEALAPLFGGNRAAAVRAALQLLAELAAAPSALHALVLSDAKSALREYGRVRAGESSE